MSQLIDRRLNGKNKSIVNRQRFIRRYRNAIRKAVSDAVDGRGIREFDCGDRVSIPTKDISEPTFRHGRGGRQETIHPGNREFVSGDRVERPPANGGGGGSGDKAGNSGTGEDDFVFQLTREEFVDLFFEDLALPDMVKTKLASIDSLKSVRAGHSSDGMPCNINIVRSLRGATARRIALGGQYRTRLRAVETELRELEQHEIDDREDVGSRVRELNDELAQLHGRIRGVPFIDTFDLRYNNRIQQPRPTTQAVMLCLMDVSGSMSQARKDIAKRFFILLYLFLQRTYERIDVVFIRHHTAAKEVDEDEFFHSRETGGTIVSSALELTREIIADRYPADDWNIYAAQASDGDNWTDDSPKCHDILVNNLMPSLQYFAYVEIAARYHQSLWEEYTKVADTYPNFAMRQIEDAQRIYPVFSDLFRKRAQ